MAVFEVSSRSTRKYDREIKLIHYRQMPSIRHIVLISQFSVSVEHYFRGEDGIWKTENLDDRRATLELSAIGISLPLSSIYAGVSLKAQG